MIEALETEFKSLDALLSDLDDEEWSRPTALPGWDVSDNVAHIIGTESMLEGRDAPDPGVDVKELPHVRNDIGAFNEAWVAGLRGTPPAEMVAMLREIAAVRIPALRAMSPDDWDKEGFTPAGMDTHGRFMRIRVFDCWMHEQDIRGAVGRPGHDGGPAVRMVLDEMTASLGFVVGKRAGAPQGSSVAFDLTGPEGRLITVEVTDRARVADSLDGPATATLRLPVVAFTRLAGGRARAADLASDIGLDGDTALAQKVADNLAYTI
jgi:uncharacterized protein (TIGR03083 family)